MPPGRMDDRVRPRAAVNRGRSSQHSPRGDQHHAKLFCVHWELHIGLRATGYQSCPGCLLGVRDNIGSRGIHPYRSRRQETQGLRAARTVTHYSRAFWPRIRPTKTTLCAGDIEPQSADKVNEVSRLMNLRTTALFHRKRIIPSHSACEAVMKKLRERASCPSWQDSPLR
jgi:hypothetical protein